MPRNLVHGVQGIEVLAARATRDGSGQVARAVLRQRRRQREDLGRLELHERIAHVEVGGELAHPLLGGNAAGVAGDRVDELRGCGAGELDIQQVVGVLAADRALAVAGGDHVLDAGDHPARQQQAVGELDVVARGAHKRSDAHATGPDLQRLFNRDLARAGVAGAVGGDFGDCEAAFGPAHGNRWYRRILNSRTRGQCTCENSGYPQGCEREFHKHQNTGLDRPLELHPHIRTQKGVGASDAYRRQDQTTAAETAQPGPRP